MSARTPARSALLGLTAALLLGALFAAVLPTVAHARPTGSCASSPKAQVYDESSIGVMLYWVPASVPASGWDIARSQDGATWTTIATVPPPSAACTAVHYLDTDGLAPDTTYYYTVGGSSPIPVTTSPGPLTVQPVGDPSQSVASYAVGICDDTGGCTQWADVIDAPFGGNIETVGDRVDCGSGCAQYNAKAEYTYADGHTAQLEAIPPAGHQLDDAFPSFGFYGGGNVGDSAWLAGQTLLDRTGQQPLLVLCSDYPVNPAPTIVAQQINAFAQIFLVDPADPHHVWVYFVRFGGNTPACSTTSDSTATQTTYKWGQLWTANVTAQLFHHGNLVTNQRLGALTFGHHHWTFSHHTGRYKVRICGTHQRRNATPARACITRRYAF